MDLDRRRILEASAALTLPGAAAAATVSARPKVLRYAFQVAETSLDPVRVNDLYSRVVTANIFEAPYAYDPLARPVRIVPLTARALPEVSADHREWTVRLRPGIYFDDDPAFGGRRRELVAADYAYTLRRYADPANKSPNWTSLDTFGIVGLAGLRKAALNGAGAFDYDREIDGLQVLDRYTLRLRLEQPRPRFVQLLAGGDLYGAVAREVVERYGDRIDAHPVGTGPFRLLHWRRSSRLVLERNPGYRDRFYDAAPGADDLEGLALLARFRGRRLPMIDRVEVSIIEEQQPRWLSFLGRQADLIERVGAEFIDLAMPAGVLAPDLAKQGVRGYRQLEASTLMMLFNLDDEQVGGLGAAQVALRRAIGLALDLPREIRLLRRDQAVPAQSPLAPYTSGYDPAFRSAMSDYDPARAQALLDVYGYLDRDGDGWRERPDGSPLRLELRSQPDRGSRDLDELTVKNLAAVGLHATLRVAQWPENLKAARAGAFMVWNVGLLADAPDGQGALARYDSRQIGGQNMSRFRLAAFDALYDRLRELPDGAERDALFDRAKRIAAAYMPYKCRVHRITTDLAQPWLGGYRRGVFSHDWWAWVDIDAAAQAAAG